VGQAVCPQSHEGPQGITVLRTLRERSLMSELKTPVFIRYKMKQKADMKKSLYFETNAKTKNEHKSEYDTMITQHNTM
jgi:hypothetical protein